MRAGTDMVRHCVSSRVCAATCDRSCFLTKPADVVGRSLLSLLVLAAASGLLKGVEQVFRHCPTALRGLLCCLLPAWATRKIVVLMASWVWIRAWASGVPASPLAVIVVGVLLVMVLEEEAKEEGEGGKA